MDEEAPKENDAAFFLFVGGHFFAFAIGFGLRSVGEDVVLLPLKAAIRAATEELELTFDALATLETAPLFLSEFVLNIQLLSFLGGLGGAFADIELIDLE